MTALECFDDQGLRVVRLNGSVGQHDWLGLRERFQQDVFTAGIERVAFDLAGHDHLPSLAYGVFVSLARDAQRKGIVFLLVRVSEGVRDILQRIHVDRLVHLRASVEECR